MKKVLVFGLALLAFASSASALNAQEQNIQRAVTMQLGQLNCGTGVSAEYDRVDALRSAIRNATSIQVNNSGAQPILTFNSNRTYDISVRITSDASLTLVQSATYEYYSVRVVQGGTLIAPTFTQERFVSHSFECTRRN